ncbi:hypothetical protein G6011_11281 [Alternaria panax]|uniref:High-affinity nicotinic acid transporter n=1 Tax=Alternaria panax TaxID=48097 RepID=A0AAD4NRJ0_9PLEO|nr:hypothetical protein G6011_11281 [Alternaria panax]
MTPSEGCDGEVAKEVDNSQTSKSPRTQHIDTVLKEAHQKVDVHMLYWYAFVLLIMRMNVNNSSNTAILNKEQGTVSGLLAYAISFMNGVGGLAGWRWLFIIEGMLPILCSLYTHFRLPDYPQTVKFLSEDERTAILADLPRQAPAMRAKTFDADEIKSLFRSPTFVPFLMIWITHGIGGWGISFVLPAVIYELGISNTAMSQILTIPPFTLVFLILMSLAHLIHNERLPPWVAGLGVECIQIVCYVLLIIVKQPVAKYVFVMIATAASQSFFAIIWPERRKLFEDDEQDFDREFFCPPLASMDGLVFHVSGMQRLIANPARRVLRDPGAYRS